MEQYLWIFWVILGVVLIIAEIFTLGFVLFWFGLAAMVAGLAGYLGLGLVAQFLTFAVVSTVLTIASRTIFSKYLSHSEADMLKTGIDALPGKVGTVIGESKGALNEAAVKVYGSTWTAFPVEGESPLTEGEKVEVVRIQGSSIYVKKLAPSKELPEWRHE